MRLGKRLLFPCIVVATLVISGCSEPQEDSETLTSMAQEVRRSMLGKPDPSGRCDSSVIDIDHAKFHALVKYNRVHNGNDGDTFNLTYIGNSGEVIKRASFWVGGDGSYFSMNNAVPNEDIKQIDVDAVSESGQYKEKCFIPVK